MSTSDTPRTDEAQFGTGRVSVDFARTLERELTAAKAEVGRLNVELGKLDAELIVEKSHRDAWKQMAGELADLIRIEVPSMNCSCEGCLKGPARTLVNTYQKLLKEDA